MGSARNHLRAKGRPVLKGGGEGKKKVRNANSDERSRGRSLLHGQDMGCPQNHRNSIEQWLAAGGGWRLAVGGGCQLAVGGPWGLSLRAVLSKK